MDAEYANYYTREVMLILIREFQSPDEEMKKIVLKASMLSWDVGHCVPYDSYHPLWHILLGNAIFSTNNRKRQ